MDWRPVPLARACRRGRSTVDRHKMLQGTRPGLGHADKVVKPVFTAQLGLDMGERVPGGPGRLARRERYVLSTILQDP
jgi:hypothetical protein